MKSAILILTVSVSLLVMAIAGRVIMINLDQQQKCLGQYVGQELSQDEAAHMCRNTPVITAKQAIKGAFTWE